MTTDPGDLVLDPTCGSGTTAYVAEQWGRRWITIDVSRVPLALARQRLLTATFPWYDLKDDSTRPGRRLRLQAQAEQQGRGGRRHRPARHAEVASPTTSRPQEEVLVDRPEVESQDRPRHRPVCVEATIPTPSGLGGRRRRGRARSGITASHGSFVDRMLEVLRKIPGPAPRGGSRDLKNVRPPAKTLSLSAEALVENGTVTARILRCRPTVAPAWRPAAAAGKAGGHRLRPGERRGEREAGLRGGPGGPRQELHPPLRDRLRHPAQRPRAGRELRSQPSAFPPPTSRPRRT